MHGVKSRRFFFLDKSINDVSWRLIWTRKYKITFHALVHLNNTQVPHHTTVLSMAVIYDISPPPLQPHIGLKQERKYLVIYIVFHESMDLTKSL